MNRMEETLLTLGLTAEQTEAVRAAHEDETGALREALERETQRASGAEGALKDRLYRELLGGIGVDERRMDGILRITDLGRLSLKDGKLAEAERLKQEARQEWADFIGVTLTRGARVETPPMGGRTPLTREQIAAIRDGDERRRAIAENPELFGIGTL